VRAWDKTVGWTVGVVGSLLWAVSLAIYQNRMEPRGFWVDPSTGDLHARLGSNNTYWPRDVRELAILLAVAGVIVIGRASVRALIVAATLGVAWLAADIWLDRIEIDGLSAMGWLAGAGCAALVAAAIAARGGPPSERLRYLAAGTAAVLAAVPLGITNPWDEPLTGRDEIRINYAITTMDIMLIVALLAVAVALVAPMLTTVRSRLLVPAGALVVGLGLVLEIVLDRPPGRAFILVPVVLLPLALMTTAAARDVSVGRLALVGAVTVSLLPCVLAGLESFGTWLGGELTTLALNPPINSADEDVAQAPAMAIIGLGLAAISLAITGYAGRPRPVAGQPPTGDASVVSSAR
jgi:hypothetical protein